MAEAPNIPDETEVRAKWSDFAFTPENEKLAKWQIAKYPEGRQRSAVMALLDIAQRQVGICRRLFGHALYARLRGRDLLHHV